MNSDLNELIEDIKDFCKKYNVDIEIQTQCLNIDGDRKVETKIRRVK